MINMRGKIILGVILVVLIIYPSSCAHGFSDWELPIVIQSDQYQTQVIIGTRDGASNIFDASLGDQIAVINPPIGLNSYVWYPDNSVSPVDTRKLSTSYHPEEYPTGWDCVVKQITISEDIMFSWNPSVFSDIPSEYTVTMETTSGDIDMRTENSYTFNGSATTEFRVQIENTNDYTLNLISGWNLVSFPLELADPSPSTVFSTFGDYMLIEYDGSQYVVTNVIEPGKAYWLLSFEEREFTISGTAVYDMELVLPPGWSTMGITIESQNSDDLFSAYTQIVGWDGTQYTFNPSTLEPGVGYWVLVLEETTVMIGNPTQPEPEPDSAYVDFTQFDESDSGDYLTVIPSTVSFTDLNRQQTHTYLSYPYNPDVNSVTASFEVQIDQIDTSPSQWNRISVVTLAIHPDDYSSNRDNGLTQLAIKIQSNNIQNQYRYGMVERTSVVNEIQSDDAITYAIGSRQYVNMTKIGSTATLSIYSDSEYTDLIEELVLTLEKDHEFSNLLIAQSEGYDQGDYSVSGTLRNLAIETGSRYEDLTVFTEHDSDNRISFDQDAIVVTDMDPTDDSYLSYDYGAEHFSDFTHGFSFIVSDLDTHADVKNKYALISYQNELGGLKPLRDAGHKGISVIVRSDGSQYVLRMNEDWDGPETGTLNEGTRYYATLSKTGTLVKLHIYEDKTRQNYVTSTKLELSIDNNYRYIMMPCPMGFDLGYGYKTSAVIDDLTFTQEAPPIFQGTVSLGYIAHSTTLYDATVPFINDIIEPDLNNLAAQMGQDVTFEFLTFDALESPETHLEQVVTLQNQGIDIFISGGDSSQAEASLDYVNQNEMLMTNYASASPLLSIEEDQLLRLGPNDAIQGKVIAKALQSKGFDAVVIMHRDDEFASSLYGVIESEFVQLGGETPIQVPYPVDIEVQDWSPYLGQADANLVTLRQTYGSSNVGFVVISFGEIVPILLEAPNYNTLYSTSWIGCDTTTLSGNIIENAPEEAAHVALMGPMPIPIPGVGFESVATRYESNYGSGISIWSSALYDSAYLLGKSILSTESLSVGIVTSEMFFVTHGHLGASGLCTLDDAGDRLDTTYGFYGYINNQGVYDVSVDGYYDPIEGIVWFE
jgi:hypothetical protein